MSTKKQYLKTKPYCRVTFRLSKRTGAGAQKAALAADFNNWKSGQTPMKALKSGDFTVTVALEKGREYQYRYVVDGSHWITDDQADKYIFCNYANTQNAVVIV